MLYYIANHDAGNAGDIVLNYATGLVLDMIDRDRRKVLIYKEQPVFDAPVIVAGGGLFLRDTWANKTSGWQWNIGIDELKRIDQPLAIFAVGMNRFRGQADFEPEFAEHLKVLVQKAVFFSVREKASIPALEPYIGNLIDRVWWQPCPASLLGKLGHERVGKGSYTVFAPAMDRLELRGDIKRIIPVLNKIPDLKIALHIKPDREFMKYFEGDYVDLSSKPVKDIISFYQEARQVIGMRSHSLLIPFGMGISVIPLISHDKIANWLLDIVHPEWGVELAEAEKVEEKLNSEQVDLNMRDILWNLTLNNVAEIKRLIV